MSPKFNEEWAIRHGVEDSSDLWGVTPPSRSFGKKRREAIKDYDIEWKKYLSEHPAVAQEIAKKKMEENSVA